MCALCDTVTQHCRIVLDVERKFLICCHNKTIAGHLMDTTSCSAASTSRRCVLCCRGVHVRVCMCVCVCVCMWEKEIQCVCLCVLNGWPHDGVFSTRLICVCLIKQQEGIKQEGESQPLVVSWDADDTQ